MKKKSSIKIMKNIQIQSLKVLRSNRAKFPLLQLLLPTLRFKKKYLFIFLPLYLIFKNNISKKTCHNNLILWDICVHILANPWMCILRDIPKIVTNFMFDILHNYECKYDIFFLSWPLLEFFKKWEKIDTRVYRLLTILYFIHCNVYCIKENNRITYLHI